MNQKQDWAEGWNEANLYFGTIENGGKTGQAIFQFQNNADAWYAYSSLANGDPMAFGFKVSETSEVTRENAREALALAESFPPKWQTRYRSIVSIVTNLAT